MQTIPTLLSKKDLSRIRITDRRGANPVVRTFVNTGAGELVETVSASVHPLISGSESDGSDDRPLEPDELTLEEVTHIPALILEPVRITDFVALIHAARQAAVSLDHFLQLRDPLDSDVRALETLHDALKPFLPA